MQGDDIINQQTVKKADKDAFRNKIHNQINTSYQLAAKDILTRSCFDCHGTKTRFPWYYNLPVVKDIIDNDISEAKKHLKILEIFPFSSHASNVADLKAIWKSIENDDMPPLGYRIMHGNSQLSIKEKKQIKDWIDYSLERLQCNLPC